MFPDASTLLHSILIEPDASAALKRTTLTTLLVGLYIGLPLIWSGMLGWIGFNISRGVSDMQNSAYSIGQSAGARGIGIAGTVASGGRGAIRAAGRAK